MTVKLAEDTIDKEDIDYLVEWLKTYPRLTKGEVTEQFEKKWSEYLGVKHSVFVNSGSSANLLMLYSLMERGMLASGDTVVVPAVSWSTDLAPVFQLGLNPVLCDCNMENLSVDINHLEHIFVTSRPKALILVSVLGMVPDMSSLMRLCEEYNVLLLEDSCESLGAEFEGKKLGSFGAISSFSMYFGHHISTIEGGMVCTNDNNIANMLKSLRSHGWSRDMDADTAAALAEEHAVNSFNSCYTFYYSGFNLRSTDLQAYLGLRQLDKLPRLVETRRKNYDLYNEKIKNNFWQPPTGSEGISNFAFPVITKQRESVISSLKKDKIECRPLICGSLGRQPMWVKKKGIMKLKNADIVHNYGMYLPNHGSLGEEGVTAISKLVNIGINGNDGEIL
jgi:CDP-4-dehydro-6-deoxyglucose reductase, E1